MKLCKVCNILIPLERLAVIPNTDHCVVHSTTKPKRGFITGTSKSKNYEVIILEAEDPTVSYLEERVHRY